MTITEKRDCFLDLHKSIMSVAGPASVQVQVNGEVNVWMREGRLLIRYPTQIEIPNLLHSFEVSASSVAVVLPSMISVNMGIKIITVISRLWVL